MTVHLTKAIFATYDHRNLEKLGIFLKERGVVLLASPESREYLAAFGLDSEDLTAAGPPASILAGLSQGTRAMLGLDEDGNPPADLEILGIVAVNLRPVKEFAKSDVYAEMDIANATILRMAARSPDSTIVLVDPDDYPEVMERLERGVFPIERRRELAAKAIRYQSDYDRHVADAMTRETLSEKATMLLQAVDVDSLPPELSGMNSGTSQESQEPKFGEPAGDVNSFSQERIHDSERPTMETEATEEPVSQDGGAVVDAAAESLDNQGFDASPAPGRDEPSGQIPEPEVPEESEPVVVHSSHTGIIAVFVLLALAIIAGGWYLLSGGDREDDISAVVEDTDDASSVADAKDVGTATPEGDAKKQEPRVTKKLDIKTEQITSGNRLIKNAITENREREVRASCPECVQKGTQLLAKDRYRNAIDWYRKALEKDPDDPFVLTLLSLAYHGAHKDDEAIETGKKALEKDPNSLWAMLVVGTTCQMKHDYVCAVKYFDMYMGKAPEGHAFRKEIRRILRRLRPMAKRQLERRRKKERRSRKHHR